VGSSNCEIGVEVKRVLRESCDSCSRFVCLGQHEVDGCGQTYCHANETCHMPTAELGETLSEREVRVKKDNSMTGLTSDWKSPHGSKKAKGEQLENDENVKNCSHAHELLTFRIYTYAKVWSSRKVAGLCQ